MTDWQTFWTEYPASLDEREFLRQVGHTIDGQPYSDGQFEAMVATIREALRLKPTDALLDVCCGNGIVTVELSKYSRRVVGIDFSAPLIEIARKFHHPSNLVYHTMSALQVNDGVLGAEGPFDRVLMYAALQHFRLEDLDRLLSGFLRHAAPGVVIVLGGVLDVSRKHLFFDTPEKRAMLRTYQREGRDRLGTWWDKDLVSRSCEAVGLQCHIDDHSPGRPGGHYRFDAIIVDLEPVP